MKVNQNNLQLFKAFPSIGGEFFDEQKEYYDEQNADIKEWWYDTLLFVMETKNPLAPAAEGDYSKTIPLKVYQFFRS